MTAPAGFYVLRLRPRAAHLSAEYLGAWPGQRGPSPVPYAFAWTFETETAARHTLSLDAHQPTTAQPVFCPLYGPEPEATR